MNRRDFLQLVSQAGIASLYPGYVLAESKSNDVIILEKGDNDYSLHASLFNKRLHFSPRFIAVCFSEQGVIQSIQLANTHKLPIAIKSGGHSFEGFSLNDGGVVIDLINMNNHRLTTSNRVIAEPSCRLLQMYASLIPQGRLVSAGSCGMLGISGLTLGGGYGLFSRQYGLACDMLKRIRMVDAQGKVHDAQGDSDLLWACRGGGNGNFGVVTELEFETVVAPPKMAQYRFKSKKQTPKQVTQLAEQWFTLVKQLPNECFSAFVVNHKTVVVLITTTNLKVDKELDAVLKKLSKMMSRRYKDRIEDLDVAVKHYFGRLSPLNFKNASSGFYHSYDDIRNVAEDVFTVVGSTKGMVFQVNTMGGKISDSEFEQVSCYPHRDYSFISEVQSYWEHERNEAAAITGVKRVQALTSKDAERAHYSNYPDINFNNWQYAYYGANNYKKLQQIKLNYDPDNIFNHPQSIRLPG